MKFKTKFIGTYLIIIVAIAVLSVFTIIKVNIAKEHADFLRNKVRVSVSQIKQVKLDIIQIQQCLTDASATGYLDGFDLAEKYFIDANRLLDIDIERKHKLKVTDLEESLKAIKVQLADYYEVGTKMAHQYIDNGREAGNVWIDKFDPLAEKLGGMTDKHAAMYSKAYDQKFSDLITSQDAIVKIVIIISVIIILVIVVMGISLFSSFNKGAGLISEYAKKLENNDISDSSAIKRKDEFGISAGQFKNSFKILNNLITSIKKTTATTANVKDSLAASAEETSATIVNIKNSTASLLNESEKMDINVSENVASVEEITANINSIKDQINEQVAMVEESTAAITEMISSLHSVDSVTRKKADSVLRLVAAIQAGNDASAATDVKFQVDVIDKIDGISGMATSIQAIAAQTNLLSMNAAIEAAHAGDAGKGFAVVADEIRKLADTSSKSSSSISKIIKEISDGIAGTGEVAQKKVDAFVVMNKEIIETKNAFDEIVTSVQELNSGGAQIQDAMVVLQDVSSNIKNAAVEMTVGAEQVMKSQLELQDISQNVNSGMQEISSGSEEIVIASDEIVRYSSELDSVVNDLKEETDKFKT